MTMDQLFAEQDQMQQKLNKREIVNVTVVQISQDNILVDTGDKKEGLIPLTDFEGKTLPAVGSTVAAVLVRKGGDERHSILSYKKAQETVGWDLCKTAFENKERVRATVVETVKGGYRVEVNGVIGFMPLSLSELHPAYKHYLPKGAKIKAVIAEFSKEKQKLILSRKQVLQEDESVRRGEVLSGVKVGEVLRVVVSKVGKETLYLRFHGIEGIVSLDNIAWKDQPAALANYKRGQRIKAKLLAINEEAGTISFGIKQLFLNPADALKKRYPYMSTAKGIITKITPDVGVEVELGKNKNKGFVRAEELPLDFAGKEGDVISVAVVGVDAVNFVVNLSVKRFESVQNRKVVAQYLRQAPRPTLGQLLQSAMPEEEEEAAEVEEEQPAADAQPVAETAAKEPKAQDPKAERPVAACSIKKPAADARPAAAPDATAQAAAEEPTQASTEEPAAEEAK